jgi:hypothetical protein
MYMRVCVCVCMYVMCYFGHHFYDLPHDEDVASTCSLDISVCICVCVYVCVCVHA